MKKTIYILLTALLSAVLPGQTLLKLKQLEKSTGAGSLIVTNSGGTPGYSNTITGPIRFTSTLSVGSSTYNPGSIFAITTPSGNAVGSITTRTSSGYAQLFIAADNPTSYTSLYHRGSTMPASGLYKPNSGVLETLSDEFLFLNYQATGKFIFGQGSTGTAGEVMRISDNQCIGISGPASVKITAPTSLLHLAAGNAAFPALAMTSQSTPTTLTQGTSWFNSGTGFNFVGNAQISTASSSVNIADYTAGRAAIYVGQTSTTTTNWALSNATNTTYVNGSSAVAFLQGGSQIAFINSTALNLLDGINIVAQTTTGTKIGTATTQKFGFFNATPVVQPGATTDIGTVLSSLGLRAAGTAFPITTTGAVSFGATTTRALTLSTAGDKITIKAGTNATIGTATLAAGTVTVATTAVTANSKILLSFRGITNAGFTGYTPTAATGFTVNSSNASDARVFDWLIIDGN